MGSSASQPAATTTSNFAADQASNQKTFEIHIAQSVLQSMVDRAQQNQPKQQPGGNRKPTPAQKQAAPPQEEAAAQTEQTQPRALSQFSQSRIKAVANHWTHLVKQEDDELEEFSNRVASFRNKYPKSESNTEFQPITVCEQEERAALACLNQENKNGFACNQRVRAFHDCSLAFQSK